MIPEIALVVVMAAGVAPASTDAPELPVVPGAVEVVKKGSTNAPRVEYDVKDPYPAPNTILFLVKAFEKGGWTLLQLGSLRLTLQDVHPAPGTPPPGSSVALATTSRGWSDTGRRSWEGVWRDSAGRQARMQLVYTCSTRAGMECVYVHVCGEIQAVQDTSSERNSARCPTE
jgi:hypothetical protein